MCKQPGMAGVPEGDVFVEQKLWRLQQPGFNEKKSVRRQYDMYLPLSGQTFNFLQNMDSDRGASLFITPNARPGAEEKTFQRGER